MKLAVIVVACTLSLPLHTAAQQSFGWSVSPKIGALSLAPSEDPGGVFNHPEQQRNVGWVAGVGVTRTISDRLRLAADLSFAEINQVGEYGTNEIRLTYGVDLRLLSVGGAYRVLSGEGLNLWLGGHATRIWRRDEQEEEGTLPLGTEKAFFTPGFANEIGLLPNLLFEYALSERVAAAAELRDYIIFSRDSPHTPAVLVGVSVGVP